MTDQIKVGIELTRKGKWNSHSLGNCRSGLLWIDLVKAKGGIKTPDGGILGIKFSIVDVSETVNNDGVTLSVGGSKTPSYEKGLTLIDDNALDVFIAPYSSSLTPYAAKAADEKEVPLIACGSAAESVFRCPVCDNPTHCNEVAFGCSLPNSRRFNNLFGTLSPAGTYFRGFVSATSVKGAKRIAFVYEVNKSFTKAMIEGARSQAQGLQMDIVADIQIAVNADAATHTTSEGLMQTASGQAKIDLVSTDASWTGAVAQTVDLLKSLDVDVVVGGTYLGSCLGVVNGFKSKDYMPKALAVSTCLGNTMMFTDLGKDMRWLSGPSQWDRRLKGIDFEETDYTVPNHFMVGEGKDTSPVQFYDQYTAKFGSPPTYQATGGMAGMYMIEGAAVMAGKTIDAKGMHQGLMSQFTPSFWGINTDDAFGKNERRVPVTWYYDDLGSLEVLTPLSAATLEIKYPMPSWTSNDRNFPCAAGSFVVGDNDWDTDLDAFIANGKATWKNTQCELCPKGHYSAGKGNMGCTKCPANTYQPKTGAAACTPCPAGARCDGTHILEPVCKAGEKKGEQTCTPCPVGQYNVNGDGICKPCPEGAVCAGGTDVAVNKDHWVSPVDLSKGVLDVYRCRPGWCCDGVSCPVFSQTGDLLINAGNVSLDGVDALSGSICTGKKMGVLCGACAPGHVLVGEKCEADCEGFGAGPFVLMLFFGFVAVFALLVLPHGEIAMERSMFTDGLTKVFANYFNIIQLLEFSATAALSRLLSVNTDSIASMTGTCMWETDPLGNLMLAVLLPITMLVALAFLCALDFVYQKTGMMKDTIAPLRESWVAKWYKMMLGQDHTGIVPEKDIPWHFKYYYVFLQLSIFCHSTITVTALRMFQCRNVAGDEYLAFSPSVVCHEGPHRTFFILAIILIAFYVVPLPFMALWTAYKVVGKYAESDGDYQKDPEYYRVMRKYGPLWVGYRVECWWYECYNLIRRILIIGMFVALDSPEVRAEQDGFVSKSFMSCFCLLLAIVHLFIRPFAMNMDNYMEGFLLTALAAVPIADYARTKASVSDGDKFAIVEAVLLYFPVGAGIIGYMMKTLNTRVINPAKTPGLKVGDSSA